MGKTFRKDSQYLPKKQGREFVKDDSWKKHKHKHNVNIPKMEPDITVLVDPDLEQ